METGKIKKDKHCADSQTFHRARVDKCSLLGGPLVSLFGCLLILFRHAKKEFAESTPGSENKDGGTTWYNHARRMGQLQNFNESNSHMLSTGNDVHCILADFALSPCTPQRFEGSTRKQVRRITNGSRRKLQFYYTHARSGNKGGQCTVVVWIIKAN